MNVTATMCAISQQAWNAAEGAGSPEARAMLAAAYMQGAAALHAAELQAHAMDRLAARLAPSIESLAEMFGMDLDE